MPYLSRFLCHAPPEISSLWLQTFRGLHLQAAGDWAGVPVPLAKEANALHFKHLLLKSDVMRLGCLL